jgi:hypothetical protein
MISRNDVMDNIKPRERKIVSSNGVTAKKVSRNVGNFQRRNIR